MADQWLPSQVKRTAVFEIPGRPIVNDDQKWLRTTWICSKVVRVTTWILFYPDAEIYSFQVLWVDFPKLPLKMAINIKLFKQTIIGTLALLIFDRNLIPMPFPVITRILSISISQTCGSLWPRRRKWPDCIFLHLLIQSFWVPCQAKISVKKTYYLKLRFMCQDMPRMQDFAPFTPELLTPSRKDHLVSEGFAGLIGQPNNFLDNLNFELGCPNDY